MTSLVRIVAIAACLNAALAWTTGCEDAEARERDVLQRKIAEAGATVRAYSAAAFSSSSEPFNDARNKLEGVIKNLNGLNPTDEGQKANKAMLTATALREAAVMDYAKAADLESQQTGHRSAADKRIDSILSLEALASGQQQIDSAPDQLSITKEQEAIDQRLGELQQRLDQLAGPIGDRTGKNSEDSKEVEQLKHQIGELRRQASEKGYADGFDTYQKAIETRRRADRIEYEIAQREMELGYSLQPDHDFADSQSKQLHSRKGMLGETAGEIGTFAKSTSDGITASREQIAILSKAIADDLKVVAESAANQLTPLYEQAEIALQKAAALAQQGTAGGSAEDMVAGRVIRARILEIHGKFASLKARGLAEHKALLERLNAAGKAVSLTEDDKGALDSTTTALTAATEQAKTAYSEALEALGQVNLKGDTSSLESLKKSLENTIAQLSGQKPAEPEKPARGAATASPPPAPTSTGKPGSFATAQDLVRFLSSLKPDLEGARAAQSASHAQTPDGRKLVDGNRKMVEAMYALDQAMREKLNTGLLESLGPMGQAIAQNMQFDFSKARPTEESDDQVVYAVPMAGQIIPITLRRIDGSWWVDVDAQASHFARALPAMLQMNETLVKAYNDAAQQVRSGTITSAQDVMEVIGQAMQAGMGAAPPPSAGRERP